MNARQLQKIGVPHEAVPAAIQAIGALTAGGALRGKEVPAKIAAVVADPNAHLLDPQLGSFAQALLDAGGPTEPPREPAPYRTWEPRGSTNPRTRRCAKPARCRWPWAER